MGKARTAEKLKGLDSLKKIDNYLSVISQTLSGIRSDVKQYSDSWQKIYDASSKFAKTIGMSNEAMKSLLYDTNKNVLKSKIGANFNLSADELIKIQQDYVTSIGRNIKVYDDAQTSMAAINAIMKGNEKELLVGFENFGVGIEDTGDRIARMFNTAAKNGITFEKLSNNVKQNIAIAQNYTFKNGLAGLESMAKKSAAIKMDMQMIAGFADKVSNVQGSLETAAKLQVLGGSFATFADPMGMLYEGLNDIEGLMDRMTKMMGGLGTFDKQTGEVRVSAFNKQRIRAAAEATGMDYSKLMESINAQTKRKEIDKVLKASGTFNNLTEEQRELLRNTATFKNGVAGVSINGEFKKLSDVKSSEDFKILAKESQNIGADVKDIAKSLRSAIDMYQGREKQQEAVKSRRWGSGRILGEMQAWNQRWMGQMNWVLGLFNSFALVKMFTGWGGGLSRRFGGLKGSSKGAGQTISRGINVGGAEKVFKNITTTVSKGFGPAIKKVGSIMSKAGGTLVKGLVRVGTKIAAAAGPIGWAAAGVAAVAAGTIAAVKVAQKKRRTALENELGQKNIALGSNSKYSARKLKIIEEALHTGQLTNAARRKLAENGDFAVLDEIDRVAKERGVLGTTRQRNGIFGSNISDAKFTITNAYFDGKILNSNKAGVKITGAPAETGYSPIIDELKRVREITEQIVNGGVNKENLNFNPKVELNIGGSIRLTTDKGVTAEIGKALLSDKNFQNALIQLVQKEIAGKPSTTNKRSFA